MSGPQESHGARRYCDGLLVSTFLVAKREWYCVNCFRFFEFLHCRWVKLTPERVLELDQTRRTFEERSEGAYNGAAYYQTCDRCTVPGPRGQLLEQHSMHATDEEREARDIAMARLIGGMVEA